MKVPDGGPEYDAVYFTDREFLGYVIRPHPDEHAMALADMLRFVETLGQFQWFVDECIGDLMHDGGPSGPWRNADCASYLEAVACVLGALEPDAAASWRFLAEVLLMAARWDPDGEPAAEVGSADGVRAAGPATDMDPDRVTTVRDLAQFCRNLPMADPPEHWDNWELNEYLLATCRCARSVLTPFAPEAPPADGGVSRPGFALMFARATCYE